MKIKPGVIMSGLKFQMRHVLIKAEKVWKRHGQELVVTSALDGDHSAGSLHYYGYALDFRTRYFDDATAQLVAEDLQDELGPEYHVLLEGNHIHVEFDEIRQVALRVTATHSLNDDTRVLNRPKSTKQREDHHESDKY